MWGSQSFGPNSPIGRAVLEMGISDANSPQAVEQALVDAAVARACDLPVSVIHVQTASEDDVKRRLLYDAGFLPVRRYALMRWRSDVLPRVELPEGFTLRSFRAGQDAQRARGHSERCVWGLMGLFAQHRRAGRGQSGVEGHDPRRHTPRHPQRRPCRLQLDGPSRGARRQVGTHSYDWSPPRVPRHGAEPSHRSPPEWNGWPRRASRSSSWIWTLRTGPPRGSTSLWGSGRSRTPCGSRFEVNA